MPAAMIALAAWARAADSWAFDGKAIVRIDWIVGIADDPDLAGFSAERLPDAVQQWLGRGLNGCAARCEHAASADPNEGLCGRAR